MSMTAAPKLSMIDERPYATIFMATLANKPKYRRSPATDWRAAARHAEILG
jgi:hypothetical protein